MGLDTVYHGAAGAVTRNGHTRRNVLRLTGATLTSAGLGGVATGGSHDSPYDWTLETGDSPTPKGPHFDGDPAEYAAAWAAEELCTRIFVAGGDPEPTYETELRGASALAPGFAIDTADIRVDEAREAVTVDHPGQPARTAIRAGSYGSVILPVYSGELHFEQREIEWQGPPADAPWPRGENLVQTTSEINREMLAATLEAHMAMPAFGSDHAGARAVAVVHEGELVGERYREFYGPYTPQRSWSVNKSLTSTLVGTMVHRGLLYLDEPVPVADWQDDERSEITLRQLCNMASGLDQNNTTGDPRTTFTPENEHAFVYFDGFDTVADAVENPARIPPNEAFEYRNANPLIAAALAREAAAQYGLDPATLIQRELFEPLGMRSSVQSQDAHGNYIGSGTWFTTVRDMARLGLLYLNRGTFAGARLLSEDWVDFVSSRSPATTEYSGFWWQHPGGDECTEMPDDAYNAAGAFGQFILVVPSYDLVIARLGVNFPEDPVGMCQLATGAIRAIEAGEGSTSTPVSSP